MFLRAMTQEIQRKTNIVSCYLFAQFEHEASICQLGNSDFCIQQVKITKSTCVAKNYLLTH